MRLEQPKEYSTQSKGYKILDIEKNEINTSRDVVFYETVFPFQNKEQQKGVILTNILIEEVENKQHNQETSENTNENQETNQNQERNSENENVTRPVRERRKPAKLDDYICYNITKYPINKYLSYEKFSEKHKAFLTKISEHKDPKNYTQASKKLIGRKP